MTQIVNYYNLTGIISLIIGIVLIGVFKIDAGYLFFTISAFILFSSKSINRGGKGMKQTTYLMILGLIGFLMMLVIDSHPMRPQLFHYSLLISAYLGMFTFLTMIASRIGFVTNYWDDEKTEEEKE